MNQVIVDKLYYYCPLNIAIEYILSTKKLRLSPIDRTNDPRENKHFSFAVKSADIMFVKALNENVNKEIKADCKVICFSSDYGNIEGYEYSRMWSLYGDRHSGVCIEIDRNRFIKENLEKVNLNLFKRICYEDISKSVRPSITIDHLESERIGLRKYVREVLRFQNIDFLFFTKNDEWESENDQINIFQRQ